MPWGFRLLLLLLSNELVMCRLLAVVVFLVRIFSYPCEPTFNIEPRGMTEGGSANPRTIPGYLCGRSGKASPRDWSCVYPLCQTGSRAQHSRGSSCHLHNGKMVQDRWPYLLLCRCISIGVECTSLQERSKASGGIIASWKLGMTEYANQLQDHGSCRAEAPFGPSLHHPDAG